MGKLPLTTRHRGFYQIDIYHPNAHQMSGKEKQEDLHDRFFFGHQIFSGFYHLMSLKIQSYSCHIYNNLMIAIRISIRAGYPPLFFLFSETLSHHVYRQRGQINDVRSRVMVMLWPFYIYPQTIIQSHIRGAIITFWAELKRYHINFSCSTPLVRPSFFIPSSSPINLA